jgi:uncharacterized protein YecT (DUF1311 family)
VKIAAVLIGLAAFGFALGAGAQVEDWGDTNSALADDPEYDSSKAICREHRGDEPPAADRPTPAQARALEGCDSEALYYGIGRPADPVKARQCAFLELDAEAGSAAVFAGRTMLMTIYANGVGAQRNLDVAIHMACLVDGAPEESHGRITHLDQLRQRHWTGTNFGYCDDITSGISTGNCAEHDALIADSRRDVQLTELAARWSPRERQLLGPLREAHAAYVLAHGDEVDLSPMGRDAGLLEDDQALREEFLTTLQRLDAGQAPVYSRARFEAADIALNAAYRQAVRGPFDLTCDICARREGIQSAERAWLRYRDAFLAFAAIRFPQVSRDSLAAWLTEQRTAMLRRSRE